MNKIKIDYDKCDNCMNCINSCPFNAISSSDNKLKVNDDCTLCSICLSCCNKKALTLPDKKSKNNDGTWSGICIYAEHFNGRLAGVVPELIGCAKRLQQDLKVPISVILLGDDLKNLIKELYSYGVDTVWKIENSNLSYFNEDLLSKLTLEIIKIKKPEIFLGGATVLGRSIFPRIATKLSTGLTADCTALEIDKKSGNLIQTRPTFGGNILATILCEDKRPQMATVRDKVFDSPVKDNSLTGKVEDFSFIPIPVSKFELLEYIEEDIETANISDAEIIVSGGRGLSSREDYKNLSKLAKKLGGALGGTRAAVDAGLVPYSHQIGQTGKSVNPSLYFAFGISGAIQHVVGMNSSKKIVAINSDPNAPIFNISHYSIVGDAKKILPEFIKQIED